MTLAEKKWYGLTFGGKAKWFVSIGPLCGEVRVKKTLKNLGGGFKQFYNITLQSGEIIQFDQYFSNGLKPPPSYRKKPHLPDLL